MLFTVITVSRPVNKNVSTGAVIRAKRGTEPDVHKLLANYQTGVYNFRPTNSWYAIRFFRAEFMNAPNWSLRDLRTACVRAKFTTKFTT